jgi:hypothetical protein
MNYRTTIISQCLLGLFLAAASHVPAADKPEAAKTPPKNVAAPDANAAWQRRLPELISDNLPLGEIIDKLRRDFPEINFVIKRQTDADGYVSSASIFMVLRSVTLPEILKAIELASDRPIQITGGPGGQDDRLVIFEKKPYDPSGMPTDSPVVTRVYNVSKYLTNRSDKEAAAALKEIEDVVRMAGRMTVETSNGARTFQPNLSIHPGTKLLIAVGRPDELMVIEQVIKELHNTPPTAKVPPKAEAAPAHAHDEKH